MLSTVPPTWARLSSDMALRKHGRWTNLGYRSGISDYPRWTPMIEPRYRVERCEIAGGQGVTENGSYSLAVDYE